MEWLDFNPFPWWLDLTALILGIIGTVFAVLTIVDLATRRPNIEGEFKVHTDSDLHTLAFRLRNKPLASGILRWMGIRREPVAVEALIMIGKLPDAGPGYIGVITEACFATDSDEVRVHNPNLPTLYELPPTFFTRTFIPVIHKTMVAYEGETTDLGARLYGIDGEEVLPTGTYLVDVHLYAGAEGRVFTCRLRVSETAMSVVGEMLINRNWKAK